MKEILKKLRKYEIRVRKAINSQMQGDFHSIFKGSGLEFDDVRAYQYGDDVRTIDWNVTAKGHGTFVKTFIEEKEQTVLFILDVSASQQIGKNGRQKIDLGKEVTALLSMAAVKESSQVGLLCYSDQREKYIKPGKGMKHSYEILSSIFKLNPSSKKTNLDKAIRYSLGLLKRRAVIFFISDFIDEGYLHSLKGMGRKHDLVVVQLFDKREANMPNLGIIPLLEKESGKTLWVNTSSGGFRNVLDKTYKNNTQQLQDFCRRNDVNYLSIETEEDYVPKLVKLFRHRNKRNAQRAR
ncbi:DUF58 domain-containing protein [Marinoscillum furvescens]|uniref:Uncharacterized protein DUF58 n=1 Tax=Marinoscillum furvescens DSM 4134 TaxID=1122208 RepID=A0A3D9L189_MARFU|nr:DUF58 domain-containing protein [Marinoscillum furvescens]RED97515.1 uncharacterized protein DUF58 [Marinoscillum furvescens DSM 4134]